MSKKYKIDPMEILKGVRKEMPPPTKAFKDKSRYSRKRKHKEKE